MVSRPAHNSPNCSNKFATPNLMAKSIHATKHWPWSTVCSQAIKRYSSGHRPPFLLDVAEFVRIQRYVSEFSRIQLRQPDHYSKGISAWLIFRSFLPNNNRPTS